MRPHFRIRCSCSCSSTASSASKNFASHPDGDYRYAVRACNNGYCSGWTYSSAMSVISIAAPTNVTVPSSSTNDNVTISWPDTHSEKSYTVVRQKSVSGSWTNDGSWSETGGSKTFGTHPEGTYRYAVRECVFGSCSDYAYSASFLVEYTPAVPGGLTAPVNSGSRSISLSWNAVGNADSYDIQWRRNAGSWVQISGLSGTGSSVTTTADGTHDFRVRACRTLSCSGWSGIDSTNIVAAETPASITVPGNTGGDDVTVSWPDTHSAKTYSLRRQALISGSWSNQSTWTESGGSKFFGTHPEGTYRYLVRECAYGTCSSWTYSASFNVVHLAMPASITVPSSSTNDNVTVSWPDTHSAKTYSLRRQALISGSWSNQSTWTESGGSKFFGTHPEGTYRYLVRECAYGSCSSWRYSNQFLVEYTPAVPGGLSAPTNSGSRSISLSWNAVGNADDYDIQWRRNAGSWVQISGLSGTGSSVTTTADGTHDFRVRSCRTLSCSSWSGIDSTNIVAALTPASVSLSTSGSTTGNFSVSWPDTHSAKSYTVTRQKLVSGSWSNQSTWTESSGSKAFSSHAEGSYRFRVRECAYGTCSGWRYSSTILVEYPPATPGGISSPESSSTSYFTVSWNAVSPVDHYELFWRKGSNAFTRIKDNVTTTSVTVNMTTDGSHDFKVRACRSLSCSGYSGITTTFYFDGGWGGWSSLSAEEQQTLEAQGYTPPDDDGSTESTAPESPDSGPGNGNGNGNNDTNNSTGGPPATDGE